MIKEILQENNNRSLSKGKLNNKKSNSIINSLSILQKLNLIKKSKYGYSLKKNNLKLLLNQNENIYSKKIKNLKTTSFNKAKKENDIIFERNDIYNLDKNINYTSREFFRNNYISNEETKSENSFDKNKYYTNRLNSNDYNLINNLDKEFEIRCLNKKLEKLKKKNIDIKDKVNKLKEQNFSLKNEAIKELNIRNNIFYSLQNIYQFTFHKEKKFDLKNMLLDLMDLKYNYENKYLIEIFYQNLNQLIQITESYNNKENIYLNIKNILRTKNKIIKELEKLNEYRRENQKYYEFCNLLFQNFETKDLDYIYNYLIKIESNNEKDIKKIIKMRNILFNNNVNNNINYYNENINLEKLKRNRSQNSNYSDLQNINKRIKENNGYLTERNKSSNKNNLIYNLKNKVNNYNYIYNNDTNNKIDKEKINNFLYSTKGYNKEMSYNYNKFKENNYSKAKSTNITKVNNTQNYIYSFNNENNNVVNINCHKQINYNDNIKNKKIHSRISSLKKLKNYHPIYYK